MRERPAQGSITALGTSVRTSGILTATSFTLYIEAICLSAAALDYREMRQMGYVSVDQLLLFVPAVFLLLLSPGPNMAFVIAHGVAMGWRGGAAAATGIAAADVLMTLLVVAGVAAIFTSPQAVMVLKGAGALYLFYLAWNSWRSHSEVAEVSAMKVSVVSVGWRACINSLLNPKAIIFFLAFLPSFIDAKRDAASQVLLLGLILAVIAWIFHFVLALLGDMASRLLHGSSKEAKEKWTSYAGKCLALLFFGLGVRLLLEH